MVAVRDYRDYRDYRENDEGSFSAGSPLGYAGVTLPTTKVKSGFEPDAFSDSHDSHVVTTVTKKALASGAWYKPLIFRPAM